VCWQVEASGVYKNRVAADADFSDDATVLAVGFGDQVSDEV